VKIDLIDNDFNFKVNRFLFYSGFLYLINLEWFLRHSQYPKSLYLPQGLFSLLQEPLFLPDPMIFTLNYVWIFTGFLAALGILYRSAATIFCIISVFAFNVGHNYGYQTHTYMPLALASMAMAFGGKNKIFLVRFIFVSIFFMAGLSKIRNSGVDWFLTENLQNILVRSKIYYHDLHHFAQKFNLNYILARDLMLTKIIAFSAIALELAAPAAILMPRFKNMIVLSLLLMQIGIYFTILVNFKFYILIYIFWVDWKFLYDKVIKFFDRYIVRSERNQ